MLKPPLINGQIYHIFNRGTDKRKIFMDRKDYLRFIHDLFEFNDQENVVNVYRRELCEACPPILGRVGHRTVGDKKPRKLIVDILAFCLMPNHFHLLVRQRSDKGIAQFMQKLGTGYVMYFNQKYRRSGTLFQGKYKAVLVNQEAQFIHLPYYIHLNPLGLIEPFWKKGKLKNFNESVKFLESYRWSSYLDYIGKKNYPSVTDREFLLEFFGGPEQYRKDTLEWLKDLSMEKMERLDIKHLLLE